jgi:hypothetical protein
VTDASGDGSSRDQARMLTANHPHLADQTIPPTAHRDQKGPPLADQTIPPTAHRDQKGPPLADQTIPPTAHRDQKGPPLADQTIPPTAQRDQTIPLTPNIPPLADQTKSSLGPEEVFPRGPDDTSSRCTGTRRYLHPKISSGQNHRFLREQVALTFI